MFGLGMGEIVIILVLALILLGPQKLPDAAKQLGKGLREFRKATEDLKSQFESELYSEPKATKPTLVEPPSPSGDAPPGVPAGGIPAEAKAEVPLATADNVPGLDAALAEAKPPPEPASQAPLKAS
jgi:sec-independent protein translocase protein TatB